MKRHYLLIAALIAALSSFSSIGFARNRCAPPVALEGELEKAERQFADGELEAAMKTIDGALQSAKPNDLGLLRFRLARIEILWHMDPSRYPRNEVSTFIHAAKSCDKETQSIAAAEAVRGEFVKLRAMEKIVKKQVEPVIEQAKKIAADKNASEEAIGRALTLAARLAFHAGMEKEAIEMGLDAVEHWEKAAPNGHYLRWYAEVCALLSLAKSDDGLYRTAHLERLTTSIPQWVMSNGAPPAGLTRAMREWLQQLGFLAAIVKNDLAGARRLTPALVEARDQSLPGEFPFAHMLCATELGARGVRDTRAMPIGYEQIADGSWACAEYFTKLFLKDAQNARSRLDKLDLAKPTDRDLKSQLEQIEFERLEKATLGSVFLATIYHRIVEREAIQRTDELLAEIGNQLPPSLQPITAGMLLDERLFNALQRDDCNVAMPLMAVFRSQSKEFIAAIQAHPEAVGSSAIELMKMLILTRVLYAGKCGSMVEFINGLEDTVGHKVQVPLFSINEADSELLQSDVWKANLKEDPRQRPTPPGAELAQLVETAQWATTLTWLQSPMRERSLEPALFLISHARFGDIPLRNRFETCLNYYQIHGPLKPGEGAIVRQKCTALLENPRDWPAFYRESDVTAAFANVDVPSALVRKYADVASTRAAQLANFASAIAFTRQRQKSGTTMDAILTALRREPGPIPSEVSSAIGTILLQLNGVEDDMVRARRFSQLKGSNSDPKITKNAQELTKLDEEFAKAYRANDQSQMTALVNRRRDLQNDLFTAMSVSTWLQLPQSAKFVDLCRPATHVVAFFEANAQLHAVVLDPKCQAHVATLGDLKSLETLIMRHVKLREQEANFPGLHSRDEIMAHAKELRDRFWNPLGITPGSTVAIADSQVTTSVSFAMVAGNRAGTFLAEDHILIRGYAPRDFWPRKVPTPRGGEALSILGIADRDAVATEQGLRQAFPTAVTLSGASATLKNLSKALTDRNFQHVSITAHGYFKPMQGLAPGQRPVRDALWTQTQVELPNGAVSALELLSLPLERTGLVVLGACESGVGPEGADGVTTLRRALRLAGAGAVISSIGVVNRNASRQFSVVFWDEMAKGGTPALALTNAQRRRINELRGQKGGLWYSPAQWAMFEITTNLPPK